MRALGRTRTSSAALLGALCAVKPYRGHRTLLHPLCTAASSQQPADKNHLVKNDRNDVELLRCDTHRTLDNGLLETQHLPHVCVAGESNAGKSSLINHLLKKQLARASSVAGKTRAVDMLQVNSKLVVTDLPGLPSRDHQVDALWYNTWEPLVMDYLRRCDSLRALFYAHDVRWKVSPEVRRFVRDVRSEGVPVVLVLTKDDRIIELDRRGYPLDGEPDAEHRKRVALAGRVRRSLGFDGVHIHYSCNSQLASSRKGRRQVLRLVESLVDAGDREGAHRLLDSMASKMRDKRETALAKRAEARAQPDEAGEALL